MSSGPSDRQKNHESAPSTRSPVALPEGTVLREQYRIGAVLGMGNFGITYRAQDEHLDTTVAIKEYYPRQLAGRTEEGLTVHPYSADEADDFDFGRRRFMQEGRMLARFDHPNIVRVRSYFEAHGTGYLVMDYYQGRTLANVLDHHPGPLPEERAVGIIQDVLRGLRSVHEEGLLHRDVSPKNVYATDEGQVILLDFGAARSAMEERSENLSVILKRGYAPYEQYHGDGDQGPWTDVYACAATLYECLTGMTPPEAISRREEDTLVPPHEVRETVSLEVGLAVMKGLAVSPDRRPSSGEAFSEMLTEALEDSGETETLTREDTDEIGRVAEADTVDLGEAEPETGWSLLGGSERVRRNAIVGGLWLVFGVAAVLGWVQFGDGLTGESSGASGRTVHSNRVTILPFAVRGSEKLDYLEEGMVDLLSAKLAGSEELQAVDPHAVIASMKEKRPSEISVDAARQRARRFGAGSVVLGTVVETGNQLQVSASVYPVGEGDRTTIRVQTNGEKKIQGVVDELARRLLAARPGIERERTVRLAALTTQSAAALKAFLNGLRASRSFQFGPAAEAFGRAVEQDTAFALAHYHRSVALGWGGASLSKIRQSIKQARRFSDRLSERDRRLLNAFAAYRDGRHRKAERRYRDLVNDYPDAVNAWFRLGDIPFHYGHLYGRSLFEARPIMKRILRYKPDHTGALFHLTHLAAIKGDLAAFDSLSARYIDHVGESTWGKIVGNYRDILLGETEDAPRLSWLSDAPGDALVGMALMGGMGPMHLETVKRVAPYFLEPHRPAQIRASGHLLAAELAVLQGRPDSARAAMQATERLDRSRGLVGRALLGADPWLPDADTTTAALYETLAGWDAPRSPDRIARTHQLVRSETYVAHKHYLMGLLALQRDRPALVQRHIQVLKTMEPSPAKGSEPADLARRIQAEADRQAKKWDEALEHLTRLEKVVPGGSFLSARERFMRGYLLYKTGKKRDALRWLESLGEAGFDDYLYLTRARHLRATIERELDS